MQQATRTDHSDISTAWVCARKRRFGDEKEARQAAIRTTDRQDARYAGRKCVHYACTRCGGFHLGSAPA